MAAYYWCSTCNRTYASSAIANGECPRGHEDLAPVGRFGGLIKGFIAAGGIEERSEAQTRHRQLIHALWSQNERDQQFYQLLTPRLSLGKFVKRMDELHLRGVDEGWIEIIVPRSPYADAAAYGIEYRDPERFVQEMYALFDLQQPTASPSAETDPDAVSAAVASLREPGHHVR